MDIGWTHLLNGELFHSLLCYEASVFQSAALGSGKPTDFDSFILHLFALMHC